ncbi:hypothetical protein BJV78DRAFT_701309 [Lactifluus subvellereus]|nr:hypothetical protein BJV78DRAFT_701309 [Lactifluus subvellereus]
MGARLRAVRPTGIGDFAGAGAMHGNENYVPCGFACDTLVGPIVELPPARLPLQYMRRCLLRRDELRHVRATPPSCFRSQTQNATPVLVRQRGV